MTLTKEEKQIQQLQMCIDSAKIMARRGSDLSVKAFFKAKIRDYKSQIKALRSA